MEDSKTKDKTQPEKTDEKDKQPAGKDKEKKEEQELVSVSASAGTAELICLSHCLHRASVSISVSSAARSPTVFLPINLYISTLHIVHNNSLRLVAFVWNGDSFKM